MKKFMAGLVIALGVVFFIQMPAEACCGDWSSYSGYDWGSGGDLGSRDDWVHRGDFTGAKQRFALEH